MAAVFDIERLLISVYTLSDPRESDNAGLYTITRDLLISRLITILGVMGSPFFSHF